MRKIKLAEGETYHIYNRGAHKGRVFYSQGDFKRFLLLLFLCNGKRPVAVRDVLRKYQGRDLGEIFQNEKPDQSLVSILAYCLMPNHFHLVLQQKSEDGIAKFMNKVGTAYGMYFNLKYEHSGVIFQGRFQSEYIDSEAYFRYIFSYVHLNPVEVTEPGWEKVGLKNPGKVKKALAQHTFSSFNDYFLEKRPERALLDFESILDFLKTQNDFEELLRWNVENVPRPGLGTVSLDKELKGV